MGPTQIEAERRLQVKVGARIADAIDMGELTASTRFQIAAEMWLAEVGSQVDPATEWQYRQNIQKVLMPMFEHLTLGEITSTRVNQLLSSQIETSISSAAKAKTVLSQIMKYAYRHDAIKRDPTLAARRIPKPKRPVRVLSSREIEAVRTAARAYRSGAASGPGNDAAILSMIDVLLGTGMRIGELVALRRCDVNLTTQPAEVLIAATWKNIPGQGRGPYRKDGRKMDRDGEPKGYKVVIPVFAAQAIDEQLARLGPGKPEDILFPSRAGTMRWPNNVARTFRAVAKIAAISGGVDLVTLSPHILRKTAATHVDRRGGTARAKELLGHSDEKTTRTHYIAENRRVDPIVAYLLSDLVRSSADSSTAASQSDMVTSATPTRAMVELVLTSIGLLSASTTEPVRNLLIDQAMARLALR